MIVTLDTNILFYVIDDSTPDKRDIARVLFTQMVALDCVITTQVLGEFLSAVRRKHFRAYPAARALVERWSQLFTLVNTRPGHLLEASALADRYKLQFWDSLIVAVARSAGAEVMLTEDMQDGAVIEGVTLLNPFDRANRARVDALLAL